MRVPAVQRANPLRGVRGNQRELEPKTVFMVIEPPLPDRADDKQQSDPVGPDNNDVRRAAVNFGETSSGILPRAQDRQSGTR